MRGGVMTRRQMVRIHPPAPIGRLIAAPTGTRKNNPSVSLRLTAPLTQVSQAGG